MSWILSLSGLLIGVICFLFVHPPPQGFDRSFSQASSLPPAGFLNASEGSFIPLDKYLVKKYEPVFGGETVFASNNGDLYTGTIDGYLLRLNGHGGVSKIAHFPGSVLGGVVTPDEKGMYLCVLTTGLVHYDLQSGRMEIVSTISDDNLPIRFADDVALAEDGKVYFTDASLVSPWIDQSRNHNAMMASLLDFFAGSGTGRALVYDPVTKSTKTLLDGLKFANGIAVSQNNDYLVVAETFGLRIVRIWIAGPRNGTVDYLTTSLPGVPDGISLASDGGYWVALNCKIDPQFLIAGQTSIISWILARLNPSLLPQPKPFGGILKLNSKGLVTHTFLDDKGVSTNSLTAVKEFNNALYLGSLRNSFSGYVDLSQIAEYQSH